jgi:alpha-glucosidase/alpha-D-xyloside xylohydrolase
MLPKAAYGYIQSKAIYPTQDQLMGVAKGYRDRQLPLDVLVVDFLNMTRQGELDLDPARWPDPAAMNQQLHSMGITTLLSVWPHFAPGTRYYDMLREKGWLIHSADGTPDPGGFKDAIGPNIDTTNPDAARWFWEAIRDRYIKPYHFDYIWLDETEPDIDPAKDFFSIGSGLRYYNVYPLFHTASVYEGFRRDFGDSRRSLLVKRHPLDLGHAEAFHPRRIELHSHRHALLGYRYRRLLFSFPPCHVPFAAQAFSRSLGCTWYGR